MSPVFGEDQLYITDADYRRRESHWCSVMPRDYGELCACFDMKDDGPLPTLLFKAFYDDH